MNPLSFLLICLILIGNHVSYGQIAQWRGSNRDGIYQEKNLFKSWKEEGPELLWNSEDIGDGFSSVSVSGGIIYATGKKDSIEYLTAIDNKGKQLWQLPYGLACRQSFPETRCTPTIEGAMVYVISGRGEVVCIDASIPKIWWKVDAFTKFKGAYLTWEIAESPLIVDDKVIYTPGGGVTTMVALNKNTGETAWQTESLHDSTAYVSPILFERGGKKIIANITGKYLLGVNAENGKILWSYKYGKFEKDSYRPEASKINCVSPVYHDGRLFITSGYDYTSVAFDVSDDGNSISMAWYQPVLDTHHGGVVLIDGYLYGSNWINNAQGNWVCVDWNSGKVMYETKWETKGSIISADGMLYIYEEKKGIVALVKPDPTGFQVISSFRNKFGNGPHWAHPVIDHGVLYIRHGKVIAAYKIGKG